jgi:nucleoside-diphosphate-sugar epimerase
VKAVHNDVCVRILEEGCAEIASGGNRQPSLYVADAVSALLFIMLHGKEGQAYNVSNESCNVHLKDFAEACASYAGTKVVYDLPTEVEAKGYSVAQKAILDNTKLLNLGWRPKYHFKNAVERTLSILSQKKY